jgi:hypothetical protein
VCQLEASDARLRGVELGPRCAKLFLQARSALVLFEPVSDLAQRPATLVFAIRPLGTSFGANLVRSRTARLSGVVGVIELQR